MALSKFDAMKCRMEEIVADEQRPFSVCDFRRFEVNGEEYQTSSGACRNYFLKLKRERIIELAYRSELAYYTLSGRKFPSMTSPHMGGTSSYITMDADKKTPIYKWIRNLPVEKQSLHNFRLIFSADGIWKIFSAIYPDQASDLRNRNIRLSTWTFPDDIDVVITIHNTDTVSVAIACSYRPIAVDIGDIMFLFELLIRTEIKLRQLAMEYSKTTRESEAVVIPSFRTWIVKMWHFGVDTIDEYAGKEFEVTIEEGLGDLFRIYTKRPRHCKQLRMRLERQEYPNSPVVEAILDKLYPNGILVEEVNDSEASI
jgi:hypothetical protein